MWVQPPPHDITHVRFFTRDSLRRLFEETGYVVRRMEPLTQPGVIDRFVVDRHPGRIATAHLTLRYDGIDDLEDLYALQYVIDASVGGAAPAVEDAHAHAARIR